MIISNKQHKNTLSSHVATSQLKSKKQPAYFRPRSSRAVQKKTKFMQGSYRRVSWKTTPLQVTPRKRTNALENDAWKTIFPLKWSLHFNVQGIFLRLPRHVANDFGEVLENLEASNCIPRSAVFRSHELVKRTQTISHPQSPNNLYFEGQPSKTRVLGVYSPEVKHGYAK